jgi:hypothetical protein
MVIATQAPISVSALKAEPRAVDRRERRQKQSVEQHDKSAAKPGEASRSQPAKIQTPAATAKRRHDQHAGDARVELAGERGAGRRAGERHRHRSLLALAGEQTNHRQNDERIDEDDDEGEIGRARHQIGGIVDFVGEETVFRARRDPDGGRKKSHSARWRRAPKARASAATAARSSAHEGGVARIAMAAAARRGAFPVSRPAAIAPASSEGSEGAASVGAGGDRPVAQRPARRPMARAKNATPAKISSANRSRRRRIMRASNRTPAERKTCALIPAADAAPRSARKPKRARAKRTGR